MGGLNWANLEGTWHELAVKKTQTNQHRRRAAAVPPLPPSDRARRYNKRSNIEEDRVLGKVVFGIKRIAVVLEILNKTCPVAVSGFAVCINL